MVLPKSVKELLRMDFKGLPGIEDYLSSKEDYFPIDISELDNLTDAIMAYTDLNKEQSSRILSLLFLEIRNSMIQGKKIDIRGLGSFLISSPATTNVKKKVFIKYKPKGSLLKRINDERSI